MRIVMSWLGRPLLGGAELDGGCHAGGLHHNGSVTLFIAGRF